MFGVYEVTRGLLKADKMPKMLKSEIARKALTSKQSAFVKQYVLLRCATQAAKAAGYSVKRAAHEGRELLEHPAVRREIGKKMAVLAKQYEVELKVAMQELFHGLTRRGTDLVDEKTGCMLPLHEMPERINASIDGYEEEVTVDKAGKPVVKRKVKLVSKATMIDMAFKLMGSYAPEKRVTATAAVDFSQLYGMPAGALDDDVIEIEGHLTDKRGDDDEVES